MTSIIGGYDTGLFDSSLFLLNRNDKTGEGAAGHGEETYVNVANGNLVVMHKDAFLPSQGEDFLFARTYNSRGTWIDKDGQGWSNNATVLELSQITSSKVTLISADSSRSVFNYDAASDSYISVDGSGAYEVIKFHKSGKRYELTRSNQTVLTFDGNGDLKSSRDTNGNLIEYEYAQGRLQRMKDDQGHVITYSYVNGNLVRVQDEKGIVHVQYEYMKDRLTAVTDRAGHRTVYEYYTDGQLKSITLPASGGEQQRRLQFEYAADPTDTNGNTRLLRWLTDADGNRTFFEYKFNVDNFSKYSGGSTAVVNALGINRRESGAAEFVEWRVANGYYAAWDPARYAADAAYRAQADAITQRHTVVYGYDQNGAVTSVVDQAGYKTTYQYDAKENLTAIVDANGHAITNSDAPYWRQLRAEYGLLDLAGQGKQVAQLSPAEVAALLERYTTRLEYDARGNLTRKRDNSGNVTTYTYTSFNKLATQTSGVGHALAGSNDIAAQDKRHELGYPRDAALLTSAQRNALLALHTTSYSYDNRQNVTEILSAGGDLTRFSYDTYGNLTRRVVYLDPNNLGNPAKQQVTQYFYDAFGQNVRTVDGEGYVTENTFDHFGNLLTRTDGRGGVSRYTYDHDNQLLTATTPEGFTTVYTYDSVGNRTAVQDANGHSVLYIYDRNNLLIATIDPKDGDPSGNRTTTASYDVVGNRTKTVDAEGRVITYIYREDNRLLEVRTPAVTNAAGTGTTSYSTHYEYDGVGHQITVTDRNGNNTAYVYDQNGLLKRQTDAIGNVTEYRYDANLNQIQIVIGAQLAADRRRVLRFSFDEEDQRISDTDAMGGQIRYQRNAVGNVTATTDANGHRSDYRFDRNNRRVAEVRPEVIDPATGQPVRHEVIHQYDGNGNRVATTDENGHTTQLTFDRDNRLVLVEDANGIQTVYTYDSRNNRTSVQIGVEASADAAGRVTVTSAANAQVQTIAYDEFNRVISRTDGMGHALATSDSALYATMRQEMGYATMVAALSAADKQALLAAYTDRYAYDKVDNLVTVTDHLGRQTRMAYDGLNRMVGRTDALGQVSLQRYDGNGNRVEAVNELGRTTAMAYDVVNRLVSQTDALGMVTVSQYDHVGNLLARTQAAGTGDARTQRYEYDLNNRLVGHTDAEGALRSYEYDAVGNRLRVVDGRGNATQYVYDARDRLIRTIDPLGFQTRVEYDGVGNRLALIDARGGISRLEYDAGNRLIESRDAEGRVTRLEYDVRGNRIVQRTAAGTADEQVTEYEYDAQNNLRAVLDAEGNRSTSDFDRVYNRVLVTDGNGHSSRYGFDALNREISVIDAEGQETRYAYDAVGNRLSQTDALGRVTNYAYDADNRATTITAADGVVTRYAYDRVDNRIAMTRALGLAEEQTTVYSYDLENRLALQADALGHATRYEYDANGNTVASIDALGHVTAYEYDANNRVVRITDPLGHAVQYRYDGNGNRVQVIDALGSTSTSYYNAVNELVLGVDNEGFATAYRYDNNGNAVEQTRFARGLAQPLDAAVRPVTAADPRDQIVRMAYDRLNRVVQRTDGEGFVARYGYDAVGNLLATTQFLDLAQTRSQITRSWYDAVDRRVAQLSAEGHLTESAYDAVGNLTATTRRSHSVVAPADGSRPTAAVGDAGVVTGYAYDVLNRLVLETDALGTDTEHAYNARGERIATARAAGNADARRTEYRYDVAGRLTDEVNALGVVTHYEVDAVARITARHDAFGSGDAHVTSFAYDANHRLLRQIDAHGVVTATAYDANGNLLSRTMGAGLPGARTEAFEYDRNNRLTARVSPLGERTAYAYDATGNQVAVTDALGRTTDYRFDRNDRLVTQTNAAVFDAATGQFVRHTVTHQYDGQGNRLATTDENGHTTRSTFDRDNRLVLSEDGNGIDTVFAYDARNNLLSVAVGAQAHADAAGRVIVDAIDQSQVTTYTYDAIDRVVAKTDGVGEALATNEGALYRTLRAQLGYAAQASALSDADRTALRALHTERYAYDRVSNRVASTDHLGRTTTSVFDRRDRLVQSTDAAGGTTSFQYDVHDRLVTQTDALGRSTQSAYDAVNRLVSQTDALGVETVSQYDHVGNLLARTQAAGTGDARTQRYEYDLNNRLVSHTDAEGALRSYEYDAVGNRLRVVDGRGAATQYVYDARDRLIRTIDPLGFQTRVEYDGVGNRLALIDARGGISRLEYDAGNRLIESRDAEGRVTRLEYDVRGNRIVQRTAAGTADEQVTEYEYDAQNNLRAVLDAEGNRSTSDFDRVYNRVLVTDGNGHSSRYGFDALNREISVIDAEGQETRYAYDAVGNRLSQTDALGRVTNYAYDADNRATTITAADGVVTRYAYDRVDNRIAMTRALGLAEEQTTVYSYDLENRLALQADALGHATRYEYDANGNTVASIDALGHVTAYEYDANNRVVRVTDPLGHAVQYRYDGNGNRVQVIDALGSISTSYYNANGEQTLSVNAEGEATRFAYDGNGNRIAETRHATRLVGAADPAQAPALVHSADDQLTLRAYDRLNRVTRTVDAEGHLVDTRYDAVGNVVETVAYATPVTLGVGGLAGLAPAASAKDRVTRFGHDAMDRLVQRIDAEGFTTEWTYDVVGNRTQQLRFLDRAVRSTAALQQRTEYRYDALNRLAAEISPIGVQTRFGYDALGNQIARTDAFGSADARTTLSRHDAAGRLFEKEDANGTVTRYELDAVGQVTREIRAFGQPEARITQHRYDGAGRRIEQVFADGSVQRMAHDALGNLVLRVDAAGSPAERGTTYTYDRVNRLLSTTVGAGTPEALVSDYRYDAFGNRTRQAVADGSADARVSRFAYDHLNRLIAQTDGNGIVTLNDYDAFGNRLRTAITGSTLTAAGTQLQRTEASRFEYDGRNLLVREENGAGDVIRREYDGAGNLRFQIDGAGSANAATTEFGYDLGGWLVRKVVDPLGLALVTQYDYDARGNLVRETNADGITTQTRFDLLDRALVTTDGEGFSVSFTYDRFGNQTSITTGQYLVAANNAGYDAAKAARAMPATSRIAYDAMDRKELQADALGTVTRYAYDARGNRVLQVEAFGTLTAGQALAQANVTPLATDVQRTSRYRFDAVDRLIQETQPIGTVIRYGYTAAGEQSTKVVDLGIGAQYRNATTRSFYDAGGRVRFEADPLGVVTHHQYDDFGNRVRTVRGLALDGAGNPSIAATPDMRVTAYEYDTARRLLAEVIDPQGLALRTAYEYDTRGNQVAVIDANGARTEMRYDAADRAVWLRDGEGFVTAVEYNGRGLRIAETRYATSAAGLTAGSVPAASTFDRRSTAAYDAAGRAIESTDARGVVTHTAYDAIGNRTQVVENASGLYGSAPRATRYAYNLANQVAEQTDASGLVTRYAYDAVYNLTEKRVENRWLDTLNRDAAGQPIARVEVQATAYRHDLNNRLVEQAIDPTGLNIRQGWRYDSLGNRIAEVAANGFAAAESDSEWARAARRSLGLVDGSGQPLAASQLSEAQRQRVLDAHTSRTWFDAAGRAVLTVDANGFAKSAQYDAVGNVLRSTQHAQRLDPTQLAALDGLTRPQVAAHAADRVTERVVDKADRETVSRTDAARQFVNGAWIDGHRAETHRAYDAVGNVVREVDANGNTTHQYYDANNRLQGRIDAEGYLTVLQLDAFGNAREERLSLERQPLSASQKATLDLDAYVPASPARVIVHEYDAADHAVRTLYPQGDLFEAGSHGSGRVQVLRSFDGFGNIASESIMHREGQAGAPATRYQYDAAGRLVLKTDPRADEQPGVDHSSRYAYDAMGNLREQVEGERVTTFEYDRANRNIRVHYPATRRVEVDAAGNVSTTENHRAIALRSYDANGNVLAETKQDGERIDYRFDRGNRQVAALNDGVYVAYGYNFAGDLTRVHRHFSATGSVDAPPVTDTARDQIIDLEVDKLGRKIAERQVGDGNDGGDDRVVRYGYDANGNQVQTLDARGYASSVLYDSLNRMVGTVNREGGVTQTRYDALGNVVARQTGGWNAPQLTSALREALVSDRGLVIEWSTDHATNGVVNVRPAGSGGAWTAFGVNGGHVLDHSVTLSGLAADTAYEYYFVSSDAFGYMLESAVRSVRTAVGLDTVVVGDVQPADSGWQAAVHFNLPAGASVPRVLVGAGTAGAVGLEGVSAFTPVQQADGSYSATLAFANADALFQIEWTDAAGVHRTGASAIQQRMETRRFDATLRATAQGSNFRLNVGWNLADVLAENGIDSDGQQPPTYSVFIGTTVSAGQAPNYVQATLEGGVFTAQFDNLRDGARTVHLQYVRSDGSTVNATPVTLNQLAGLDQRLQNLEFDFPDADANNAQLRVRTRRAGTSDWTDVSASAISGLSANLLGLAVGEHEYQASLVRGGQTVRQTGGSFTMREPASIAGLDDQANAGAVQHSIDDTALSLPGLLPVAANETIALTLTDALGNSVPASFAAGTLDLAVLTPGSYTLRAHKTRTTSTTAGTPPVTTTTTTTVNDIRGTIVVGPLTLTNVVAGALEGSRTLTSYALGAERSSPVEASVGGTSSADHSWSFFDDNGRRTFSNENGGVWTRYFHDAGGNVTKEVRFQRRDAQGNFVNAIADEANRPSAAQLIADYDAALAAHNSGADTLRATTRTFDAAKNMLSETEHSRAHGAVTTRAEYDRFNNKTLEVSAVGIAGLENSVRTQYDGLNRVVRSETGAFVHLDEAGSAVTRGAMHNFGYDGRGNRTLQTDARGFTERFHYDGFNRLGSQWDGQRDGTASTLRTDYVYDAFDRVAETRAYDLTGRAAQGVQVKTFSWTTFDQLRTHTDALGHTVQRAYDTGGNQVSETDARGNTERAVFNAESKLIQRTDRLGASTSYSYDAYGQKLTEIDANGRVTRYTLGAFGQILGSSTGFSAGYGALLGEGSMSESHRFDWAGRLAETHDSFGKHFSYGYNDADEQIRIADLANGKAVDYVYDALGRRVEETLTKNGLVQRHQTNHYNNQGRLTGVNADAGYDAGGGAVLSQQLNVAYQFDAAGNRVRVGDGQYSYDAGNRMTRGVDDKRGEVVSELLYDGYGNRLAETRGSGTTHYAYDAGNRVTASSAGEEWHYDANGNATFQRNRDGSHSTSEYNAENRTTLTHSVGTDGKLSASRNTYDAVGNIVNTRVDGSGYGFDEVTQRDVRYLERSKRIANSYAKGAKGLEGATSFTYNSNGDLAMVDRGRKQGASQNSVAVFDYDLEGHIIGRADKATALTNAEYFAGSSSDPDNTGSYDEYGSGQSATQLLQQQLLGGATGATTRLQSYLYANNKPISEAAGDQVLSLKKLTLTGATAVFEGDASDSHDPEFVGWDLAVQGADLRYQGDGSLDRAATARAIAARAYLGWSNLSATAQAKVAAYVQEQLPATIVVDGPALQRTKLRLHAFIQLMDTSYANLTQVTDYNLRQIGADGIPGGTVQTHQVRTGDTLQSVASTYFGSPSYWYLIADANGLTGNEVLAEGTTLTIPNTVANSANEADTFKVYNESEIIGSTSPEIRTIKKKKKWYQKLIQILIIVIMIVAAVITAGAALAVAGSAVTTGLLGVGASLAGALGVGAAGIAGLAGVAVAAGIGAAVYAGASILTQGLAVAAGLQDKFSWKQVGKAAISGAVSGAASFLGAGGWENAGAAKGAATAAREVSWMTRVGIEAGKQLILDGKISNVAGLIGASVGGGAFGTEAAKYTSTITTGLSLLEGKVRGRGDNAMAWVSLATAALFDSGALASESGQTGAERGAATGPRSPNYLNAAGEINWKTVAVQVVGTAIIADRMGEDAALGYAGNALGEFVVQVGGRYLDDLATEKQRAAKEVRLENAKRMLAEADAELAALREKHGAGTAEEIKRRYFAVTQEGGDEAQRSARRNPLLHLAGYDPRETAVARTLGPEFIAEEKANRQNIANTLDTLGPKLVEGMRIGHETFMDSNVGERAAIVIGKFGMSAYESLSDLVELGWKGATTAVKAAAYQAMFTAQMVKSLASGDWDGLHRQAVSAVDNAADVVARLGSRGEQIVDGLSMLVEVGRDDQVRGAFTRFAGTLLEGLKDNPSQAVLGAAGVLGSFVGDLGAGKAAKLGLNTARWGLGASYVPGALDADNFVETSSVGAMRRGGRAVLSSADELLDGLKTSVLKHYTMSAYRTVAESAVRQGMADSFRGFMKDPAIARLADAEKPGAIYGLLRAESLGWKRVGSGVSYDKGNHGFDFIFEDPKTGRLAVLETKSGRGLWSMGRDKGEPKVWGLSKDTQGLLQGTEDWIKDRAGRVISSRTAPAADKQLAERVRDAIGKGGVDSYASFGRSDQFFKLDLTPVGRYNPANTTNVPWPLPAGMKI